MLEEATKGKKREKRGKTEKVFHSRQIDNKTRDLGKIAPFLRFPLWLFFRPVNVAGNVARNAAEI